MSPSKPKQGPKPRIVRSATKKSEGPAATPKLKEGQGASLGKSANSSAGGAAGQLTSKD